MKITFVLPVAGMSGGIRVISIYAANLRKRGHEVTLVSLPRRKPSLRERVRSLIRRRRVTELQPSNSYIDGLGLDHRVIDRYRPIVDADLPDADVVIATWWETARWVRDLSPAKGKKAYFVQDYGAHDGQPLESVAETWRYGLHMFTISAWLRALMLEHTGFNDIPVISNSVDFSRFNSPERDKQELPTVGFLHDLRSQKGTDSILLALRMVQEEVPDLRIVSFGPHRPIEPLPKGSEFFHCADDKDLPLIYSKCDVWLFASTLEGFGLPIIEAMACRTPVVATPAGAAPELLSAGGGRLIPHGEPTAMAKATVGILKLDNADWKALSRNAYESVQVFTWDEATDMFEYQLRLAVDNGGHLVQPKQDG